MLILDFLSVRLCEYLAIDFVDLRKSTLCKTEAHQKGRLKNRKETNGTGWYIVKGWDKVPGDENYRQAQKGNLDQIILWVRDGLAIDARLIALFDLCHICFQH